MRLARRIQQRRHLARGLGQRIASFLLTARGVGARHLPRLAQLGSHRAQRIGPGRQTLLVTGFQRGLQLHMGLARRSLQRGGVLLKRGSRGLQGALVAARQFCVRLLLPRERIAPDTGQAARRGVQAFCNALKQTRRALFKGFGKPVQRRAHLPDQRSACVLMLRQGRVPDARDRLGRCLEARRQAIQLSLHGMRHGFMQGGGFTRKPRHRRIDHRLKCRTGNACTLGGAVLQGLPNRRSEVAIGRFRLVEKRLLAGDLAFAAGRALLFQGRHHGLQPINQCRHRIGLPLQQLERLFTLMGV